MRVASAALDAEVAGSSQGDTLNVTAWRGGVLVAGPLDVTAWNIGWNASRQTQGQASLTIADPDGTLSPWSLSDPLGPGGSRLLLSWTSGASGIVVPLGWWRIRKADPIETWRIYNVPQGPLRVSGGATVTLDVDEDITATAALNRIDGVTVTAGATVYTEIRRLLQDVGAVDTTLAPADVTIAPSYTAYPQMRTDAVDQLLAMANAFYRVGPDGSLQVVPLAGVGPSVWTIAGGDTGVLVSFGRPLDDAETYNGVTSTGTDLSGNPLIGRAFQTTGPLAWGGPFGEVVEWHPSIATTQAGVDADAATTLANQTTSGTVDLAVECLAHPGIQVQDIVTLMAPTIAGDAAVPARVVAMAWASAQSDAGSTPGKRMSLTLRAATAQLEAVALRVRRG